MYILDSDFWFSFYFDDQSTHSLAKSFGPIIVSSEIFMLNITLQELGSVISRKKSQKEAIELVNFVLEFGVSFVYISKDDELEIWKLFSSFTKKNISFVDCTNLYFAQKMNCKIVSFDKFYPDDILLQIQ